MRKKLLSVLLVFGVVAMAIAIPALAKTKNIEIDDNYFVSVKKHTVNIKKNTTLNWQWKGSNVHNVTLTKAPKHVSKFHSATKKKGVYAHKFTKAGTYTIICTVHAPGMKMTVKVT